MKIKLFLIGLIFIIALFNCKPKPEPEYYSITINITGWGEVMLSPEQDEYEQGTQVEATATPGRDWSFTTWEGDLSGTEATQNITIDSDKTITAVFDGNGIFVATTGDDGNDGTISSPMATINAAIDEAVNMGGDMGVFVSEGTYEVDYATQTHIVLVEGISLYGGFSSDFLEKDPDTHTTTIQGNHTDDGTSQNFNRVLFFDNTITNDTHINGFSINGGNGNFVCAIYGDMGSPTIINNSINGGDGVNQTKGAVIYGGSPLITQNDIFGGNCDGLLQALFIKEQSTPTISYNDINAGDGYWSTQGIVVTESSGEIHHNTIHGGTCDGDGIGIFNYEANPAIYSNIIFGGNCINSTKGMYNYNASTPLIYNNIIRGGNGYWSIGIQNYTSGSDAKIYNNVISGGNGNKARAVEMRYGAAPEIINNIIFTEGGSNRYGIYEYTPDGDPAKVENNDIFNCPTALYYDEGDDSEFDEGNNGVNITDIATVNGLTDTTAGANVSVDPQFTDWSGKDYHLTADSPASVTEGGQDLSTEGITDDMDGNERTVPWSMGAYEYD